ncbi:MAG: hypothetical protein SGI77_02935 [Pirellulaceae bacterium]|nr:hypothetical protein [Pirellulaceae bacterium]
MANARRSLGDALAMTPDKLAFIHGSGASTDAKKSTSEVAADFNVEPTRAENEAETDFSALEPRRIDKPAPRIQRKQSKERDHYEFNDDAMLGMANLLVPLTTRLQPKTAAALKRAGLEQKLRGRKPSTVQEIAEAAIQNWLRNTSYLD